MKAYKVPTKTVVQTDCAKMMEDLKAGPLYLSKADYDHYKLLAVYALRVNKNERPACKTITVLERGNEVQYMKLTLNTEPPRTNNTQSRAMTVRNVVTGEVTGLFRAVSFSEYGRIRAELKRGKTMLQASKGVFTEGVVEK